MKIKYSGVFISSVLVLMTGCGSGSEPTTLPSPAPVVTTQQGNFYLGNISGVNYVSGNTSGTISTEGEFEYELIDGIEQPVEFSVAGIELGTTLGKSVVTPIDLVVDGTVDSVQAINKTALLRLLSVDPSSKFNVNIDQRLIDNATDFAWPQPDFTSTEFSTSTQMVQILGDINVFLLSQKSIPTFGESQAYFKQRMYCAASGIYYGDIAGDDTGHLTFGINPIDGSMTTLGWSDTAQNFIFVQAPASPDYAGAIRFVSGASLSGDNYDGVITHFSVAQGTWTNTIAQTSGTFTAEHLDRDVSAVHHFSAAYIAVYPVFGPGPAGTYSFSLHQDGTVTGTQVNIAFGSTTTTPITGTWDNRLLSATVEGGATINASLDFGNMAMFGEWSDSNAPITSGGIIGTGCQLNE